jgi:membrane-bound serine protease (ClpP class)
MLIDAEASFLRISWKVIAGATIASTLFFVFVIGLAYKAFRRQPTTGKEGLVGEEGVTLSELNPAGSVEVHGEIWNAYAAGRIEKGQRVVVEQVDAQHLKIKVKPM